MTRNQIAKKLEAANVNADVKTNKWVEVAGYDEDGDLCREASERQAMQALDALGGGWECFAAGWGGWVLRPAK